MNDQNDHRDHALSRVYREGAWPEPSRQIDQAILAASRRERSFARRWAPSFAIAATVVLTSTLALKVYREQPDAISPSPADAASRDKQPSTPERAAEPKAAETKQAETKPAPTPAPPVQPVATPKGFSSTMDAGEAERLERIQRELDLKRSPPPGESPVSGAAPAQKSAFAEKAAPALKKEATAPAPAALPSPRAATGKPSSSFASSRESAPAVRQDAQPQALEADRARASPPAPQGPAVTAPAANTPAQVSPAANAAAISGSAAGATLMVNRAASKASERSPQTWIEDIRKLMAAGKSEEAGQEIAEFKKRYPDYALPDDLR
jgi:hypothetical protein